MWYCCHFCKFKLWIFVALASLVYRAYTRTSFQITPIPSVANIESNDAVYAYDEVDSEVVRCYQVC